MKYLYPPRWRGYIGLVLGFPLYAPWAIDFHVIGHCVASVDAQLNGR